MPRGGSDSIRPAGELAPLGDAVQLGETGAVGEAVQVDDPVPEGVRVADEGVSMEGVGEGVSVDGEGEGVSVDGVGEEIGRVWKWSGIGSGDDCPAMATARAGPCFWELADCKLNTADLCGY
jgi:hypothetical protein